MSLDTKSIDHTVNRACEDLGRCATEKYAACEEQIRRSPVASVLFAASIGYVLNFLPVFRLGSVVFRVAFFLLKPAVFLFGLLKLIDYIKSRSQPVDLSERDPVLDSTPGV